jgi:hypothetical protein
VTNLSKITTKNMCMEDVRKELQSHREQIESQYRDDIQRTIRDCEERLVKSRQEHQENLTKSISQSKKTYIELTSDTINRANQSRDEHVRFQSSGCFKNINNCNPETANPKHRYTSQET